MTLPVPPYLNIYNIQSNELRYPWDDWNVEAAERPVDELLFQRLQKVSQRGAAAFSIACGEWIIFRFASLMKHEEPFWYLECAWAQIIDARYGREWDPLQSGWVGPVMGPIRQALMWVGDAIEQLEDDLAPAKSAVIIARLVEHVLPVHDDYHEWSEQVLERLERFFPFNATDRKGEVVPRETMNPSFNFKGESTESLINGLLARLNRDENPFLNSPEEMLAQGFKGTPYVYSIEDDRRERLDW